VKTTSCGTATVRAGDDGLEILLVKPRAKQDKWAFPKGHAEIGESEEDTAVRETLEETGYTVQLLGHVLGTTHVKLKHEDKTVIIHMAVLADPPQPVISDDGENAEIAWHSIDKLPDAIQSQHDLFASLPATVSLLFPEEDAT
jgi:8-oxo-dGTP diphosphatase